VLRLKKMMWVVTNRAATFVGEIDLICYCWEYFVNVIVVCEYCGSVIVVCKYNGSVVDADKVLKRLWKCYSGL
jgi:hypothetical protein